MSDDGLRLQREVQELKAETRRLRRTIEGAFTVLAVVAVLIFMPGLLIAGVIALIGFFAFLISPFGRKAFPYSFRRKNGGN